MKESHGEGVANHTGSESCLDDPRGRGESLTGGNTGELLNSCLSAEGGKTPKSGSRVRGLVAKAMRPAARCEQRVVPAESTATQVMAGLHPSPTRRVLRCSIPTCPVPVF